MRADKDCLEKKRVLIAEDDDAILASIQKALEKDGYEVTTVSNGKAAQNLIADGSGDSVEGKNLHRRTSLGCGTRHSVDDAGLLVLGDGMPAALAQQQQTPGAVISSKMSCSPNASSTGSMCSIAA